MPTPGDKITVYAMHNSRETVPLTVARLDLATVPRPQVIPTVFAMHNSRETVPLTVVRLNLATVRVSADPRRWDDSFAMYNSCVTVPLTVGLAG